MKVKSLRSTKRSWLGLTYLVIGLCVSSASAQDFVVQLPTQGAFSVQTSVSVPDSGTSYLGGVRRNAVGSVQRGPMRAMGGSSSAGGASVTATIIDLDALDRMIRSQANQRPVDPNWGMVEPRKVGAGTSQPRERNDAAPAYAYMLAMSHKIDDQKQSIDDARYYLTLAGDARRRGHWNAMELYYKLAWNALPEKRRMSASEIYLASKRKAAELEKAKQPAAKASQPNESTTPNEGSPF
jgi:hypothetical protein